MRLAVPACYTLRRISSKGERVMRSGPPPAGWLLATSCAFAALSCSGAPPCVAREGGFSVRAATCPAAFDGSEAWTIAPAGDSGPPIDGFLPLAPIVRIDVPGYFPSAPFVVGEGMPDGP